MAIDFPASPSVNQEFTSGTTTWKYDGVKWNLKTTGTIGPQGPQGTQGAQGTQGPQGAAGTGGSVESDNSIIAWRVYS